jgi:hypothetical protein
MTRSTSGRSGKSPSTTERCRPPSSLARASVKMAIIFARRRLPPGRANVDQPATQADDLPAPAFPPDRSGDEQKAEWIGIRLRRIGNRNVFNGYAGNELQKAGCNSLGHEDAIESRYICHFFPNALEGHPVISVRVQCQKRLDSGWCRDLRQKITTISLWGHVASIRAVVPKGVIFATAGRSENQLPFAREPPTSRPKALPRCVRRSGAPLGDGIDAKQRPKSA